MTSTAVPIVPVSSVTSCLEQLPEGTPRDVRHMLYFVMHGMRQTKTSSAGVVLNGVQYNLSLEDTQTPYLDAFFASPSEDEDDDLNDSEDDAYDEFRNLFQTLDKEEDDPENAA